MPEDGSVDTPKPRPLQEIEADIKSTRDKSLSLRASSIVSFFSAAAFAGLIYTLNNDPLKSIISTDEQLQALRADAAIIIPLVENREIMDASQIRDMPSLQNGPQIAYLYERTLINNRTLNLSGSAADHRLYDVDADKLRQEFRNAVSSHATNLEQVEALKDKIVMAGTILLGLFGVGIAWRSSVQWRRANRAGKKVSTLQAERRLAKLEANLDRIAVTPA